MRKFMFGIIGIIALIWAVKVFAATEIEKLNVDFDNQDATMQLETGNFQYVNSV